MSLSDVPRGRIARAGIPLVEVGKRLKQLHEAILANGMAIKSDSNINVELTREDTALAVQLTVYLFDYEEEKENAEQRKTEESS